MPALLAEVLLCARVHIGAIVNKMVPFQDGWGEEHKKCASADEPDTALAVLADAIPFILEVGHHLSLMECKVFDLFYVRKVTSTSEIARLLGVNQTGDIRNYLSRIAAKLAKIGANLSLIKVTFTGAEDDYGRKTGAVLSRHQLTPRQIDTSDKQPVCRALPPSCRNRKAGVK